MPAVVVSTMLRGWFQSRAKQKPTDISLGEFDTAAASQEKQIADSSTTGSATAVRANMISLNGSSVEGKAAPPAEKAHVEFVALASQDPQAPECSSAPSPETQTADGNAKLAADVSPDDGSEWSFVIIDGDDEDSKVTRPLDEAHTDSVSPAALDPPRRLNYSAASLAKKQAEGRNATQVTDLLPVDSSNSSHPLSRSVVTLVEKKTTDSSSTPSRDVSPDSDSEWSFDVIDDEYLKSHGLAALDEAHTDPIVPSSDTPLSEYKYVDKNVREAEGVPDEAEEVVEEDEVDGRPRLFDSTSTTDGKRVNDNDAFLTADAYSNPGPLNGASEESLKFNDEEIPLKEDADTFIITRQDYPSERNGTLKNELAAAVRSPVVTATWAGEAAKRKVEDVLAPHTLKRAFADMKGIVTDGVVTYVNAMTAGYDVPEMAGRVIEPIVNVKDKIPSREETDKFVDQVTDKVQTWFGRRKLRGPTKADPLDASGMAHMGDAHQVFASEMGWKALQVLVDDGICDQWQIEWDRRVLKWKYSLQQALVSTLSDLRTTAELTWRHRRLSTSNTNRIFKPRSS
ncbi:hypothetical protein P171DRAFT_203973 [Karstenula rhodostoma CBS 690.94]|uniref:Uncharacterized protein n=1 Tax=Karstenula rhodostoma CBS 690.94 TaxID=1392251 RepID=A0A9P4PTK6_9PLEO|nr:hypothetical protein P171DRAFT_203973 [Karstenula rhodostoma CBS 690.94]